MPTLFLTGANRGLGLEFARQYAAEDWRVIAACRDPAGAETLRGLPGRVEIHALDVGDFAAVARLGRKLAGEAVDIVIANAGISGPRDMDLARIDGEGWGATFRINTMAPLAVAGALAPALARGAQHKAIAISSRMGSIGAMEEGGRHAYRSSKAALNATWRCLALDNRELVAVVLHPGWVRTDMGGASAPLAAAESVAGMRGVIAGLTAQDSGRFFNYDGTPIPW